jgi:sterol desaturase/sphingolipid hydroxylase (fatty acid hydroxylase superfamily)
MSDTWIRFGIFLAMFAAMSLLERAFALVPPPPERRKMQWVNLALGALGALGGRLIVPLLATVTAWVTAQADLGLLTLARLPSVVEVCLGIVALDLAIYWQHRWMHAVPALWRLHRTHHLDEHLDASAAVRFHPIEILLSAFWRAAVVVALGIPVLAVLLFEIGVNAAAIFHHANLRLPASGDRLLRLVVVTPAMHRVHHSVLAAEQRSNFGFSVTWWDRLFGSYRERSDQVLPVPRVGVEGTVPAPQTLRELLANPIC